MYHKTCRVFGHFKDTLCFVSVCFVISINYQKTGLKEDSAQGTGKYIFSENKCYDDHT